jgi:hypothetical protein
MNVSQSLLLDGQSWAPALENFTDTQWQVGLVFGPATLLKTALPGLRGTFPGVDFMGCSTADEIYGLEVHSHSLALTLIRFEKTPLRMISVDVTAGQSQQVGENIAGQLLEKDLRHVLVFSDGLHTNGSELVRGLRLSLPGHVTISGGLAGDGDQFSQTFVYHNNVTDSPRAVALGLYGPAIKIGLGSQGGWDTFGPQRLITRSNSNVLFELDNQSALALYKEYLGSHAAGLPGSALLFPLSIREAADAPRALVRTVLGVDEANQSMTFAGDLPQGHIAQFMKANLDRLVDGAQGAADNTLSSVQKPDLAILVSCVGRRMVLKQRVEEEVEAVADVLGQQCVLGGFYSYGEIAPLNIMECSELHNQTMTITAFHEEC